MISECSEFGVKDVTLCKINTTFVDGQDMVFFKGQGDVIWQTSINALGNFRPPLLASIVHSHYVYVRIF